MTRTIQTLKRHAYGFTAAALTVAVTLPSLLVGTVSAQQQVSARSIEMSSASPGATNQTYNIKFTGAQSTEVADIVVVFCNEASTPLIGMACTAPTGFSVSSAEAGEASVGTWTEDVISANILSLDASVAQDLSSPFNIEVSGITNPSTVGTFYARILTYASDQETHNPEAPGTHIDNGGVALSITDDIDVTARVMETLTFCVANATIAAGCGGLDSETAPDLELGTGDPAVLSTDNVDTATAWFQISTNASGATVVKLRNGALSGGLNSGSNAILPIDDTEPVALSAGDGRFGVRLPVSVVGDDQNDEYGTVTAAAAYGHAANYNMRAAEVTSTYGDTIASATGPLSNINVPLTFAATASNTTPAGIYTANISLVASSSY